MISENLQNIVSKLPDNITLVAVSKFHPAEAVLEAYNAGQRIFGESRVQEITSKAPLLPEDTEWHFIGHLQTNKVAQLLRIGNLKLIHSIDSNRLLQVVDKEAVKAGRTVDVLLEIHVADEETKSGFSVAEIEQWMSDRKFETLKATHIRGVMGMATNTDDIARIRADFHSIRECYNRIIGEIAPDLRRFDIVSMGMSHDYPVAIEEGATMIRVGTNIFGKRTY
ncbi:MAG: YggS family pyridoxal phosphate-dependent enzyme [Muribaculaceae bacterium]|jgi:pyridoxal phosphate enzyme, YggS family|nr:YggS family pyridoxal phosphate-dependent enzyme [Muribaculaceae bacterium]